MNENEEAQPVVDPSPLLELSPELQLNIFSFLLDDDLDSLSKSCGQFRKFVHVHRRKLYRRNIFCILYCGTHQTVFVNVGQSFEVHWSNKDGDQPILTSVSHVTDEKWKQILEETFLGLSIEQFFDKITERMAGICLKLNNLEYPHFEILQHALKHAVTLQINCRVDSLSREMQFRHLFAPRYSLELNYPALGSDLYIVDDEFCRVAGFGQLDLHGWLMLTEDQLLTLVRRSDLTKVRIRNVASMSYESIRSAAQVLLETSKVCQITFIQEPLEFHLPFPQFLRQIGDERIEIYNTSSYQKDVMQYHYTNKKKCVKICVIHQPSDGHGVPDRYSIEVHANRIEP